MKLGKETWTFASAVLFLALVVTVRSTQIGVFPSYDLNAILDLFPMAIRAQISAEFVTFSAAEPTDFDSAFRVQLNFNFTANTKRVWIEARCGGKPFAACHHTQLRSEVGSFGLINEQKLITARSLKLAMFLMLKRYPDMVAFIGRFSPALGSIAREVKKFYYVIDVDNAQLTRHLINLRRFIAHNGLHLVDTPGHWAFSSEACSVFNDYTRVASSKLAYLLASQTVTEQALNPAYPQFNTTSQIVFISPDIYSAAALFATPTINALASSAFTFKDVALASTELFHIKDGNDNLEAVYNSWRSIRDEAYEIIIIDTYFQSIPDAVFIINQNLGMLNANHLWSFLRYETESSFVRHTADSGAWKVFSNDANASASLSTQDLNLFFQVSCHLLSFFLQFPNVSVPNSFSFSYLGKPSISRFQAIEEVYVNQLYNGTVISRVLWRVGVDILGRASYVTDLQANVAVSKDSSFLSYSSLQGRNVLVGIVVDPPFVIVDPVTREPTGLAIEIINQLSWYIGFTVTYYYVTKYARLLKSEKILSAVGVPTQIAVIPFVVPNGTEPRLQMKLILTIYGATSGLIKYLNQSTNSSFLKENKISSIYFGLSGLYYTATDATQINFVQPFITPVGVNIIMRNDTARTTWQFMQPFSTGILILMAIVVVVLPMIFSALDYIVREGNEKPLFTVAESFWYVYSSLTMASVDILPIRFSAKFLTLAMVFAFTMLLSAYEAGLITLFFLPRLDANIMNLSSAVAANSDGVNYPILLLSGSLPWRYLNAYNQTNATATISKMPSPPFPQMAGLWNSLNNLNKQFNQKLITVVSNYSLLLPSLIGPASDPNSVLIGFNTMNQWLQNQHCGLRVVGDPVDMRYIALATPLGAQYAAELSAAISVLQSNQTIANIVNYYIVGTCSAAVGAFPLRIKDLAGIFYILATGFAVSLLFAVLHRLHHTNQLMKWRRRAQSLKFGRRYVAIVKEINADGAIIDIAGQPKLHLVPNQNFAPNSARLTTPGMNDVIVGNKILVQYFGKDQSTRKKLFVFIRKVRS